jgi:hypothetical protein
MAIVIGEAIQYHDAVLGTPEYEIFVVILRICVDFAYKAVAALSQILNIFNPPGRPEVFAFQSVITSAIF